MKNSVTAHWRQNMQYTVQNPEGEVNLDASPEHGGENKGLRPKALMLTSLAGCTGMDISSLFKKMRIDVSNVSIEVSAELTDEHPKTYKNTHIVYTFQGKNLPEDKIKKAVDLSVNKYCGVIEMFRSFSEVTFEIRNEEL
ncbi:OsmC family protein [Crocinitomix algicola]|uniref:OsmC family protein n=1 Tax=Crocinitomix algicola TaxID=1740263 RepID=UPI00082D87A6|nr:OsmC family protein [Crocinitomix algicola]